MPNLSDLFPADTKRGRLAELLYQRSIAEPAPVPDVRSTPPQIMGGLLGMIDSAKRRVGKNLSELVNNPDQYLRLIAERLPETAMKQASDPGNFIPGGGLIAQTAWHGSPHKFAKFQMDKIGTGEGAQAYGHGLYLAEAPEVAKEYKRALSGVQLKDGSVINPDWTDPAYYGIQELAKQGGDIAKARPIVAAYAEKVKWPEVLTAFDDLAKKGPDLESTGHLYKTDIPDEAVARFLDWDKPLSQQAPEVQAYVASKRNAMDTEFLRGDPAWGDLGLPAESKAFMSDADIMRNFSKDPQGAQEMLAAGIPGIRYLDGGSRGAGQGSSNFVVFDEDMIRILERNGEPTGLQPWAPGEYQLRDLLPK